MAVKVISPEAVSGIGVEQFLKEIRYSAGLQHPNIMPLYDSGTSAGYPFFVMPFIDGGSLRDTMRKGRRMTLSDTLAVLGGITDALEHAHANRVVHCDIKPENILLAGKHVYLADFGISRAIHAEVRALGKPSGVDTSAGTPPYVSPEQAAGEPHIDARADIYSLACVTYEMLTGKPPFSGNTATEVVAQRFTVDPPRLSELAPDIPRSVDDVLQRAMAVDRYHRYLSVREFLDALRTAARTSDAPALVQHAQHMTNALGQIIRKLGKIATNTSRIPGLSHFVQDLRFAIRSYRKRWGRTSILLATIALGIGINTAVFSVVYAAMLRPLPYPDADRLAFIERVSGTTGEARTLSMASVDDIDRDVGSLEAVGAYTGIRQSVIVGDASYHVPAHVTTEGFFETLGVAPLLGSTRVDDSGSAIAVISHSFWQRAFGSDSAVLGQTIIVSGATLPIAAVMPPTFRLPQQTDVWMPQDLRRFWGPSRSASGLNAIARISPNTSAQVVQEELSVLARAISTSDPLTFENDGFRIQPLQARLASQSKQTLLLLLAVVTAILAIACTNIAGVMAADITARKNEMTIRRSLGASSARLVRQLLTESLVLGCAGAVIALTMALASLRLIDDLVPGQYLHSGPATLDPTVAVFALALGVLAGVLFGLAPAIAVGRSDQNAARASRSLTRGVRDSMTGRFFVAAQYGLSLAVVVVALLTVRSLIALLSVDMGFTVNGIVTAELSMTSERYEDVDTQTAFRTELAREMSGIVGVRSVSFVSSPPLVRGANLRIGTYLHDPSVIAARPDWRTVDPGYFSTMGIALLRGRDFTESDNDESRGVVIVNDELARRLWADADPIGQRLQPEMEFLFPVGPDSDRSFTVIGVVSNTVHYDIDEDPVPTIYMPARQHSWEARSLSLVLSIDNTITNIEPLIRDAVTRVDRSVPVGRINTMVGWVTQSTATPRFQAGLLSAFAGIALTLVLLGMYGVTSQSVQQRRGEMAVRAALGADSGRIVRMLTMESLVLIGAGQLVGTVLLVITIPVLSSLLFAIPRFDWVSYVIVSPIIAGAVLLSAYFPARRAGRTDPMRALKA